MIRMGMRYNRPVYRTPGIDIEATSVAIKAGID
jgi:hypothetical protein